MTVKYDEAMHHSYLGKRYGCTGSTYEDINWFEEGEPKPTKEELEAVWETIKDEVHLKQVQRERAMQYPVINQLVVALWEKLVEADGLTSDAIASIQAEREQVKANNPK